MSTLTSTLPTRSAYRDAQAQVAARPSKTQKQRGFFARLLARMIEARRQQAMLELRRHSLHLPSELEQAGRKISARNEDSLPFVR